MFQSFSNSWQLAKASWAILRANKQLMWFPVMSALAMIAVFILLFIPVTILTGVISMITGASSDSTGSEILGYILLFLSYVVTYTVGIFFNTALIGSALHYMDGEEPSVKAGLDLAKSKLSSIIGYAVISATVGVILKRIQDSGIIGQIVSGLFGMAWNLVTFLVVPILVTQDVNPIDAIKNSGSLFKKTWGEQVVGNFSIGMIIGLIMLALIIVGGVLIAALAATESVVLVMIGVVVVVGAFIVLMAISSAMDGIYRAALYRYAETGSLPEDYDIEMIQSAFKPKKKK